MLTRLECLTPEERNKIMGHRQGDSSVYVTYYMSTFIDADCQSICFGSAPQHDLVHLAGRLLRHGGAPTALTDQQRFEVSQDPKLVAYCRKKTKALEQWKSQGYRSRQAAEGTKMASRYDYYKKKADSLSKRLKADRLQRAIKDFHGSIHIEEVHRQLSGIKPSAILAPRTIEYELPERAQAARLFSKVADGLSRSELNVLRIDLITTLTKLSQRRESPCRREMTGRRKPSGYTTSGYKTTSKKSGSLTQTASQGRPEYMDPSPLFCPFCRGADKEVGDTQREKRWRIDSLGRHICGQHLKRRRVPFDCPYDGCTEVLEGAEHFANHTARQHALRLPPAAIPR